MIDNQKCCSCQLPVILQHDIQGPYGHRRPEATKEGRVVKNGKLGGTSFMDSPLMCAFSLVILTTRNQNSKTGLIPQIRSFPGSCPNNFKCPCFFENACNFVKKKFFQKFPNKFAFIVLCVVSELFSSGNHAQY